MLRTENVRNPLFSLSSSFVFLVPMRRRTLGMPAWRHRSCIRALSVWSMYVRMWCCKFKIAINAQHIGQVSCVLERVECEKEWRYVRGPFTDDDGHTRRARVKKHTIRSTVLDSKTSDSYEINQDVTFSSSCL